MGAVETLGLWGIQRPAEVVELAGFHRLPLNVACALLDQESRGGLNIWGHDAVNDGGIYTKGSPVTRDAYVRYKAMRGVLGAQGVGPTQLTYHGYQDQADALGGCFDWRCNIRVGFAALASLVHDYGQADGIRRYNGSGAAANVYRDQVLARASAWAARLTGISTTYPSPTPMTTPSLTKKKDVMIDNMQLSGTGSTRLILPVGRASIATARAWLSATVNGPEVGSVTGYFQSDTGGISDFRWTIGFSDGHSDRAWIEFPDGTTQVNLQYTFPQGGTVCLEALPK
jgi:hypothetical protein